VTSGRLAVGNQDEALEAYGRALSAPKQDVAPRTKEELARLEVLLRPKLRAEFEQAKQHEGKGEFNRAVTLYTHYLSGLSAESQEASEVRGRLFALTQRLPVPLAIPEEARKHFAYGMAAFKHATKPEEWGNAADELNQAIRLAPWWPDPYYNLGLVLEKLERYAEGARMFSLYLEANPHDPEAEKVRTKMYELRYLAKQKR
jgi:tetratricopeptide (TPR) repeat protein